MWAINDFIHFSMWTEPQHSSVYRHSATCNLHIFFTNVQNAEKWETRTSHRQTVEYNKAKTGTAVEQRELYPLNRSWFFSVFSRVKPVICCDGRLNPKHKTDAIKAKYHFMFRLIGLVVNVQETQCVFKFVLPKHDIKTQSLILYSEAFDLYDLIKG